MARMNEQKMKNLLPVTMKTFVFLCALTFVLPLRAQTNASISVLVQVPSITIRFPSTMKPGEIDNVLKKFYGTNLTFEFTVKNDQTDEQIKIKSNSMPSKEKLQNLFFEQRQYSLSNDFLWDLTPGEHQYLVTDTMTGKSYLLFGTGYPQTEDELEKLIEQQTNAVVSGESETLTAFRKKFPQFANIPDSQVVLAIGENFPNYLQQDKQFAQEFAKYSTVGSQSPANDKNNDIEERKAEALERQADAQERQADALERTADATEDQLFQQEMSDDDIDFDLDMLSIQNQSTSPDTYQPLPTTPVLPVMQSPRPTLIFVPGQGTFVASPEVPGQPQMITGPGLNGPIIISH
jgi:hypothetical protein